MGDTEISGEVFAATISYVETNHGVKVWKKIAGELSSQHKGLKIEAQGRYEFSLFSKVVHIASKILKMGPTEFVHSVGFFWISHLSQNPKLKSIFATMGKSFPLALHSLNSLHNTVSESGLYPHLSCPQLEILSENQGWMKCLYTPGGSVRCGLLQHLMVGIIKGLGYDFFGLSFVDVQISEERPGPITSYVLEVTYASDFSEEAITPTSSFSDAPIVLDSHHINSLFPFHFIVDREGECIEGGSSFKKAFDLIGKQASSMITVTYPNTASGPLNLSSLSHLSFSMDLCCLNVDGVEMRGQVLLQSGLLVFLGNPVFKSVDKMVQRGLAISDFAFHDTGISSIYSSLFMETAARKHGKLGKISRSDSKIKQIKKNLKRESEPKLKRSPTTSSPLSPTPPSSLHSSSSHPLSRLNSASPPAASSPSFSQCPFSMSKKESNNNNNISERNNTVDDNDGFGREGGMRMLSMGEITPRGEKDGYGTFCDALYKDASIGFPFIKKLLSFTEGSYDHQQPTAEAVLDFFSETGDSIDLIKLSIKDDLLTEAGPTYLRGNTTGVHLVNVFLARYGGNFISSFCEDLSTLNLGDVKKEKKEKQSDIARVTSFLKKRVETTLNPQVCQLLHWIFLTAKEAHSKEIAGLAVTNFFFLRFVLARMVLVSPETKKIAKKIQKHCVPHHPAIFEIMEICSNKGYVETDTIANVCRKKLSSRHSYGAEKLQKICLYFMRDLMNTEEGKDFYGPIVSSAISF